MATKLYTIGKGKLLFKPEGSTAYVDLGNSPDLKINVKTDKKEHFSSRSGISTKDMEVVVKQTATGSFTLDEPNAFNLKMFIMSDDTADLVQTSGNLTAQEITLGGLDEWVSVGKYNLSAISVTDSAGTTTYTAAPTGTDYEIDAKAGIIRPLTGGTIAADSTIKITAAYAAITVTRADAATATTIRGDLYFVGDPPVGKILDIKGYASISPSGDLSVIGENWLDFSFDMEFLSGQGYNGLFEVYERGTVV